MTNDGIPLSLAVIISAAILGALISVGLMVGAVLLGTISRAGG